MYTSRYILFLVIACVFCASTTFAAESDTKPAPNYASCVPEGTQALFTLQGKSTKALDCSATNCDRRAKNRQVIQSAYVAQVNASKGDVICGKATHFADLQGRTTASGLAVNNAVFEMMATRVHPLGTVLRACRISTGRCAYFAVVDVGPGQGDGIQIFDFLEGGARYLGFWGGVNAGTAKDICTETVLVMEGGKKGATDDAKAALAAARCLNQSFEKDAGSMAGALQNMVPGGVDTSAHSATIQERVAGLVRTFTGQTQTAGSPLSQLFGGTPLSQQTMTPLMSAWQSAPQMVTQSTSQAASHGTAVLSIKAAPSSVQTGKPVTLTWSAAGVAESSCSVVDNNNVTIARSNSGSKSHVVTSATGGAAEFTLVCKDTVGKEVKEVAMAFVENVPLTQVSASGDTFLGEKVPEFEGSGTVKLNPSDTTDAPAAYDDLLSGQDDVLSNSTFGVPADGIAYAVDPTTGGRIDGSGMEESAVVVVIADVLKNIQTALNQIGKILLGR